MTFIEAQDLASRSRLPLAQQSGKLAEAVAEANRFAGS
jgi:hypothetical protein